ncbi:MAG: hypothetical protein Q9164_001359 [Protoblastenia rupestris]
MKEEKLRSTCDSCGASKVKCDRQKPRCGRCISLGSDCIYGHSRRKGKPSSKWPVAKAQPPSPVDPEPNGSVSTPGEPIGTFELFDWCASDVPDISTGFQAFSTGSNGDSVLLDDFSSEDFWNAHCPLPNSALQNGSTSGLSETTSKEFSKVASESETLATSVSSDPDTSTAAGMRIFFTNTSHHCANSAIATLQELYELAFQHRFDGSVHMDTSSPSSDHILKTNRKAVQNLDQILSCCNDTCTHDSSLPFILATIGAKVLGWYRAVYNGIINPSCYSSPAKTSPLSTLGCPPSSTSLPSPNEEAVSITSITMGDFKLDRIAETQLKAQLLLCELQNVGKAFDVLAQQNRGRSNDLRSMERGLHEAFEQFLRSSLNDLVAKLDGLRL